MKNLVCKNRKFYIFISLAFFALTMLSLLGFAVYSNGAKASGGGVSLDKTTLTLEKSESYTFTVSGAVGKVVWTTTDDTVISVNNGKVTALKEGGAVVIAKADNGTDRCLVKVTDNSLVLQIDTNVGNENLNILIGDSFNLVCNASFNGKTVDAAVMVDVLDKGVASVANGQIKGLSIGNTQIIVRAEWNGLSAIEVIELGVVNNIIASFDGAQNIQLYTDSRAGETSYVVNCSLSEDGKVLANGDYSIVSANYNEDVIKFNLSTMKITAKGKGESLLELVYRSEITNNTVKTAVNVTVGLYTHDKSSEITIPTAYIDEGEYDVNLAKVYADIFPEDLANQSILAVDDVTEGIEIKVPVRNNKVDMSNFIAKGIVGERRWRIQSEQFSYIVSITVKPYNNGRYIVGEYLSEELGYKLVLTDEEDAYKISISDVETGNKLADGSFEVRDDDRYNGRIKVSLNEKFGGDKNYYGIYMDCKPMRLSIEFNNVYYDFNRISEAPYNDMSDVYTCNDWRIIIALDADKTCEFDTENVAGINAKGVYELTPTGIGKGLVTFRFTKKLMGKFVYEGSYTFDGKKYSFGIKNGDRTFYFVQEGAVGSSVKNYEGFNRLFTSRGIETKTGEDKVWCNFYFNSDGTMYFQTYYFGNPTMRGVYSLVGDKLSGKIIIDLSKPYCDNTHFEGEYWFDEAKGIYLFDITIYGSGFIKLTFTQNK